MIARILRRAAVGIAALVCLLRPRCFRRPNRGRLNVPRQVLAAAVISDFALAAGGVFSGQVVDSEG